MTQTNTTTNSYNLSIKKYSDNTFKVIKYNELRIKQYGAKTSTGFSNFDLTEEEKNANYLDQRQRHLYEVRRKINDYARNNDFQYFVTLTFDPKQCGKDNDLRFDLMKRWLDRLRKQAKYYHKDFRYLFVPELHKGNGENSQTVHWHGLIGGYCPKLIDSGKVNKTSKNSYRKIYNLENWEYGFSNVQKVTSRIGVANYIQKYMTKELLDSPVRKNKKKYWVSKNLELPKQYFVNYDFNFDIKPSFENDICSIYELSENDFKQMNLLIDDFLEE